MKTAIIISYNVLIAAFIPFGVYFFLHAMQRVEDVRERTRFFFGCFY